MKKIIYIALFTLLGILVQFLVHAVIEIGYIKLLLTRYELFGLGLPFSVWFTIHDVFAVILFVIGALVGYRQGTYWWIKLYVLKGKAAS